MARDFLKAEHPIYTARKAEWETNERRLRGGREVLSELVRFDWETKPGEKVEGSIATPGEHYELRQSMAIYLNFAEMFAGTMSGQLLRKRPAPGGGLSFGKLGEVQRVEGDPKPSQAELTYYNVDGVGNAGSHWDAWWDHVTQMAIATGHRWLFCEAPTERASSRRDEMRGVRPFLVHYSPLRVLNWEDSNGRLDFAVVRFGYRRPRVASDGSLEGNAVAQGYRLLVRAGYEALGTDYVGGGWWEYDAELNPMTGPDGAVRSGKWESTGGEIPLWTHFYQRDSDQLSRAGTTEIGAAAVAYMNLDSAATFDAWDAAMSMTWLLNVSAAAWKLATEKILDGSRVVPVPSNPEGGAQPQVVDSAQGAVTAGVMKERLQSIRDAVREIAVLEATSLPQSSGESKAMGFADKRAPRLALMASELQASQMTALHFLEQRFGHQQPTGSVTWPLEYDLEPAVERIERYLDLEGRTGYRAPTVGARAMRQLAEHAGLTSDDADADQIEKDYAASIAGVVREETGAAAALRAFGGGE